MKFLKILIALFYSVSTLAIFVFLSYLIYIDVAAPMSYMVIVSLILLGLYLGYLAFFVLYRRGVISGMTYKNSASDLDDLVPVEGDGVYKIEASEIPKLWQSNEWNLSPFLISIWGDGYGRGLDKAKHISAMKFEEETKTLIIEFLTGSTLTIVAPRMIYHAYSYIKIMKAKEVKYTMVNDKQDNDYYKYLNNGLKIETSSNTDWTPHYFDMGIGMSALLLQK